MGRDKVKGKCIFILAIWKDHLLEYMKIWFNIQVIIYRLLQSIHFKHEKFVLHDLATCSLYRKLRHTKFCPMKKYIFKGASDNQQLIHVLIYERFLPRFKPMTFSFLESRCATSFITVVFCFFKHN